MLQRVAYYREICGHGPGQYPGTAMEVQALRGQRLDELENPSPEVLRRFLDEPNAEVIQTVQEILQERDISALQEDVVPNTILEITEIRGLGPKMARRLYDELGIVDLASMKTALDSGTLPNVKGFGQKMVEKISEHILKIEKTQT